ncbi:2OG-Fe(II) oxygenase [Kordiimonas aestuarii]|uniref:2OG-Fe(II) oxygenase n=1 Tax=Kordiimonas aestuarii TaxID=1005925 RepID=UPI0021D1B7C3|nr:2OG-Fe(II) oxygenase [Kordiimonas aestuarii]
MMNMQDTGTSLGNRIQSLDWERTEKDLLEQGFAILPQLLTAAECSFFRARYDDESLYRKQVFMARHGYGEGDYRYYRYPLPDPLQALRHTSFPYLAHTANEWAKRLQRDVIFPENHEEFQKLCHGLGQLRPTPLILKYTAGGYNRLHQDLYGEVYFPFQMAVLLSQPGEEFEGGEFVLVENRPRMQSRPRVIPLRRGDAVVFAVNERPQLGKTGYHKVSLRHGVSDVTAGTRYTLGVIYHDAL